MRNGKISQNTQSIRQYGAVKTDFFFLMAYNLEKSDVLELRPQLHSCLDRLFNLSGLLFPCLREKIIMFADFMKIRDKEHGMNICSINDCFHCGIFLFPFHNVLIIVVAL